MGKVQLEKVESEPQSKQLPNEINFGGVAQNQPKYENGSRSQNRRISPGWKGQQGSSNSKPLATGRDTLL